MTTLTPRRVRTALAAIGATAALVLASPAAHAADIDVDYDVNGSTTIASTGSTINLGPTVLSSHVGSGGDFTAELELPGTRTEFKLAGFIPVTANVAFEPVTQTTGQLSRVGRTQVLSSTSSFHIRLSNIKAAGLPLFAGPFCRTKQPVVVQADTPTGESFDIGLGGRLVGTYSLGDFQHCGLNTLLINAIIPGDGNSIELNLTNGRLAS